MYVSHGNQPNGGQGNMPAPPQGQSTTSPSMTVVVSTFVLLGHVSIDRPEKNASRFADEEGSIVPAIIIYQSEPRGAHATYAIG